MELLDSTEQLVEAESQITKLQSSLDNIMKEKVRRYYVAVDPVLCFSYPPFNFMSCEQINFVVLLSLETWTLAVQTSSTKRNVLNSCVAAMKLSAG